MDYIFCKDGEPFFAIEVKSGRIEKIPTRTRLAASGIQCPFVVVTPGNIKELLKQFDPEEIVKDPMLF